MGLKLNLKGVLRKTGKTKHEIADYMGVTVRTLENWDNGNGTKTIGHLVKLEKLTKMPYDKLFTK